MGVRVDGAAPVAMTDASGSHRVVSLNELAFDDGVAVPPENWDNNPENVADLTRWLAYLSKAGQLRPLARAIRFTFGVAAARPGAWGNGITFTVDKVIAPADPIADTTIDATVGVVSRLTKLTPENLVKRLGDGVTAGTTPSLVTVTGAAEPKMPLAMDAPVALAEDGTLKVDATGGETAFTLTRVGDGGGASSFTVQVTDVTDGTFTLIVTWSKTADAVALGGIDAAFGYVLKCQPDRFSAVPGVASFAFAGGTDADPSDATDHGTAASAAVLSA